MMMRHTSVTSYSRYQMIALKLLMHHKVKPNENKHATKATKRDNISRKG